MLTLSGLTKRFGGRILFEDVALRVNRGDRLGLVGANGAGKTTLFSLILGDEEADGGQINLERGVRLGFLPQESAPVDDETVLEIATGITPEVKAALKTLRLAAAAGDDHSDAVIEAQNVWAENDGHSITARAKRILTGLAFREADHDRPARGLSGGWIMRAHLARLLVQQPDLLLLDEPTNHLDLESLVWFREHLRYYQGAILMISHDRDFLNQLVHGIVEISRQKLNRYTGSYDQYREEKAAREVQHAAAYANQQAEIARLKAFADRFRAKASKASQAQSKLKQIERMELLAAPEAAESKVRFRFPQPPNSGHRVVAIEDLHHAYGDLVVYRGINFEAERGDRIVLVGPNGAGKSTLLKLLAGVLDVQRGTRTLGHNVRVGYFAQHRVAMLDSGKTVLQAVLDLDNRPSEQTARAVLGSFLFRGDDVFKPVSVLSGGEKSRLALARLLLDPPNFLLMDEPTTHLDIPSIDALTGALEQFSGTIVFISHDVHFIRTIAKKVLHISAGNPTPYAGDYDYYLEKSGATSARDALVAGEKLTNAQPVVAPAAPAAPRLSMREQKDQIAAQRKARREQEKKITALEQRIITLEARQREIANALEDPAVHEPGGNSAALSRELTAAGRTLYEVNIEWERATEELEEMPNPE